MARLTGTLARGRLTLGQLGRYLAATNQLRMPFRSTEFAAYFHLSAPAAREALDGFAAQNLLCCCDVRDDIDRWELTKDGAWVLGSGTRLAPRFGRELQTQALAAARFVATSLPAGVTRMVVGGRWLDGYDQSPFLIGFEVTEPAFSQSWHGLLVRQVIAAFAHLRGKIALPLPMFYHAKLPARLARQQVVFDRRGDAPSSVTVTVAAVDATESQHRAGVQRLGAQLGFRLPLLIEEVWHRRVRLHRDADADELALNYMLEREVGTQRLRARSRPAPFALDAPPARPAAAARYASGDWDYELGMHGLGIDNLRYREVLAQADLYNRRGLLEARADALTAALPAAARSRLPPAPPLTLLCAAVLGWQRQVRARLRAPRPATTEAKARPHYFICFDVLNYARPEAVGIVRQPARQDAKLRTFYHAWGEFMAVRSPVAKALAETGLEPGFTSLRQRHATDAEVAAFEDLRKALPSLYAVLFFGDGTKGTAFGNRFGHRGVKLPPALEHPPAADRLYVRFLGHESAAALYRKIENLPDEGRRVRRWVLDATRVPMQEVVERAASGGARDPLVRGLEAGEGWRYAVSATHWVAQLAAEDWEVRLSSPLLAPGELQLRLRAADRQREYQLAPLPAGARPYRGMVCDLLDFVRHLRLLTNTGLEALTAHFEDAATPVPLLDATARLDALETVVDRLLRWHHLYHATFPEDGEVPLRWLPLAETVVKEPTT